MGVDMLLLDDKVLSTLIVFNHYHHKAFRLYIKNINLFLLEVFLILASVIVYRLKNIWNQSPTVFSICHLFLGISTLKSRVGYCMLTWFSALFCLACTLNTLFFFSLVWQCLKHQRKWKSVPNYTKSWYDRGPEIYQAEKYMKGARKSMSFSYFETLVILTDEKIVFFCLFLFWTCFYF